MASQPFDVPRWLLEDLRTYDPMLRVVWDRKDEYWRIERKTRRNWAPNPEGGTYTSPQDWECARDGYVIVLRVPYDCLDRQVLHALFAGDIQRRGGHRRVAAEMEAEEARRFEKSRRDYSDTIDHKSRERWTGWNTNYPLTKQGRSWASREPGGRG